MSLGGPHTGGDYAGPLWECEKPRAAATIEFDQHRLREILFTKPEHVRMEIEERAQQGWLSIAAVVKEWYPDIWMEVIA